MPYSLLLITAIILFFNSFGQSVFESKILYEPMISEVTPSLVSEDHTAEGFLVALSTGRIIHFFRLSPGYDGDHIQNNSRIVKRYSDDNAKTWSENETVFDSEWDDRNVHGGIISDDRIVMFFREYNAIERNTVGLFMIYSDNGGIVWSLPVRIKTEGLSAGTHSIIEVPGKGHLGMFCTNGYVETRFSADGTNWNAINYKWDYRDDSKIKPGETSFSYIGNGRIVGLCRDNNEVWGSNYYQVESPDFGTNWTEPIKTNIADSLFCPSPLIFFNQRFNDVWVIATDRRNYCGPYYDNKESEIWIYKNNPSDIFGNPRGYSLFQKIKRPYPNYYRFYGYPVYTRMANGNYLIIFSESWRKSNTLENADFYQFEIQYNEVSCEEQTTDFYANILSQNYPNPVTDGVTQIDFNIPDSFEDKDIDLLLYDVNGKLIRNIPLYNISTGKNSIELNTSALQNGVYYYQMTGVIFNNKKRMVVMNKK